MKDLHDQPLYNIGSEAIPAYGVCELKSPGVVQYRGRTFFTVGKPTSQGKTYFVNGRQQIGYAGESRTGAGARPFGTLGVHALFDPELDPSVDDELGPIADQWHLGSGNGFVALGDVLGAGPSAPGYPPSAATKRVRVAMQAAGSVLRWGAVSTEITAATGVADPDDWGAGEVQFYDDEGAADGDPVAVDNLYENTYIVGEHVCVDTSFSPHRVVQGPPGRVIYAQVNAPSGVGGGDTSFAFDNAREIVGECPADGTGTAQNQYAQVYANDDWVLLFFDEENEAWLTERGGTAGSQVIYFELTQDKSYADDAKLAKPVDESGAIVSGADAFYVVDDKNQYWGRTATGEEDGYRGHAWKFTDDYNSTGVPGWRIIDMEGPAYWMIVVLDEDYDSGGTDATPSDEEIYGRPSRNRRYPATGSVSIRDDQGVASHAKSGQTWLVAWNETEERYIFVEQLKKFVVIKGTATVSRSDATFTLSTYEAVRGAKPGTTITVTNQPAIETNGAKTVYARYDTTAHATDEDKRWTTADAGNFVWHLQGLADWDASKVQVIEQYNGNEPHWQDTSPCPA